MNYKRTIDISKIDKNKWTEFVNNHPNGNIFQTPEMYDIYKKTKNYEPVFLAIVNENNDISAILLAVIQKEHSGILGNFTARSIIWGGPLVKGNDTEIIDKILKEYNKNINHKSIYTQFRNLWDWKNNKKIFLKNEFKYEDHLDIIFNLNKGKDEIWQNMERSRKKGIKQAYKKDIIIKALNLDNKLVINETYEILERVYKRVRLPLPDKEYFYNSVKVLFHKKLLFGLGSYLNNELIGVRLVLCYNNIIYDWYAGAKYEFLSYRPNDVLPWEIMKWGSDNGYEIFDFGGAGKPDKPYGVRDYKLKFGGELVNFGRFEKIHKPILMRIGKFGLKIYQRGNIGLRK